mmetsp:Transcript_33469/g.50487  ORF Transcript_33469/g.50487 Transcript_33469/m.50487 type:complete len:356 (-) Transcript_33469:703-1770(-)
MLWVDKHRPKELDLLSYHDQTTKRLKALVEHRSIPHLFVYGPSGAGKRTRIMALLREIYGNGALKLKLDKRTFETPTKRSVEVNMISSNYHIELCPADAGLNDRFVVQEIIKEIASSKSVTYTKQQVDFKIVVLTEVDRLSKQAQAALRRTMEKYTQTCRLILVCNSAAKVMEPVRSRCLGIRVPAPSMDDICKVLKATAEKERITLPDKVSVNIARESSRNLRRAILMFEALHVQHRHEGLTEDVPIQTTDWQMYIHQLAADITKEQSPQKLLAVREKLYELLVHCIPATIILKTLVQELMINLDDSLKPEVLEWAAFYEHRLVHGNKEIFHLEAFVAKFMALYKKFLNDLFGM